MRASILYIVVSVGLAVAMWAPSGRAQSEREFVFADDEGHLLIRFPGNHGELTPWQAEEILNSEFSRMVHDRLRADLLFEAEPRDPEWSASMEPQIAEHVKHAGPEFTGIFTECRAHSCRVIMEQRPHWTVPDHRAVLETVQKSIEAFIAAHPEKFEAVFMITAYYQEFETPHIKAFLWRLGHAPSSLPAG